MSKNIISHKLASQGHIGTDGIHESLYLSHKVLMTQSKEKTKISRARADILSPTRNPLWGKAGIELQDTFLNDINCEIHVSVLLRTPETNEY